jgi:DNA-binding transcriptional MerR regulator
VVSYRDARGRAKTVRYYEEIGLLPPPPRGANGYRRYGKADANRLHVLRRIRLLGVPLSSAKTLLAGGADARCAEVQRELLALVDERVAALDREIAELQTLRASVEAYQQALASCAADERMPFSACLDMRCIALHGEPVGEEETVMDEDVFNSSIRKIFKTLGVTPSARSRSGTGGTPADGFSRAMKTCGQGDSDDRRAQFQVRVATTSNLGEAGTDRPQPSRSRLSPPSILRVM